MYSQGMRSKLRGLFAATVTLVISGALASGCGSDDSGGGTATGGTGGSTGGSGGTGGGTGGTGGSTGGTGGGGGCKAAPDPNSPDACDVCQGEDYMGCACEAEDTACADDDACFAIWECIDGTSDAGTLPCDTIDAAGAECVNKCMELHPAGKAKYLASEKCNRNFCAAACDTAEYCGALDKPVDGGGGSDASSDASFRRAAPTPPRTEAVSGSSARPVMRVSTDAPTSPG